MSTATTGAFLLGCLVGACGVFVLTGLAFWFLEWREAWQDGHRISGDEMERAKRREEKS